MRGRNIFWRLFSGSYQISVQEPKNRFFRSVIFEKLRFNMNNDKTYLNLLKEIKILINSAWLSVEGQGSWYICEMVTQKLVRIGNFISLKHLFRSTAGANFSYASLHICATCSELPTNISTMFRLHSFKIYVGVLLTHCPFSFYLSWAVLKMIISATNYNYPKLRLQLLLLWFSCVYCYYDSYLGNKYILLKWFMCCWKTKLMFL